MGIQIIAIRTGERDDLHGLAELIVRDDQDGKVAYVDRKLFAEWVNDNPQTRVYLRTSMGENKVILTFKDGNERFLSTEVTVSTRDSLLRLPRYLSAIRWPETPPQKVSNDPDVPWWWFWWLPK